jgi:hypothetical protein
MNAPKWREELMTFEPLEDRAEGLAGSLEVEEAVEHYHRGLVRHGHRKLHRHVVAFEEAADLPVDRVLPIHQVFAVEGSADLFVNTCRRPGRPTS